MQNSDNQNPVKARTGRKTKFSPKLISKLLSYIKDGLNLKQACQAVGIGETTLREWRQQHEGLEERLEAARETMRAKILKQIKEAGAKDYRALVEYLRLSFPEYRYGAGQNVNIALQQNMSVSDPDRAAAIAKLEEARARALADKSGASEPPLQLEDASGPRAIALEAERKLAEGQSLEAHDPEPERLRERPPTTVVERDDWRDAARQQARRDEVAELLGD